MRESNTTNQTMQTDELHTSLADSYALFLEKHLIEPNERVKKAMIDAIRHNGLISTNEMMKKLLDEQFPFVVPPSVFEFDDLLTNSSGPHHAETFAPFAKLYSAILALMATTPLNQDTISILANSKKQLECTHDQLKKTKAGSIDISRLQIIFNAIRINLILQNLKNELTLQINKQSSLYFFQSFDQNLSDLALYLDILLGEHQQLINITLDSYGNEDQKNILINFSILMEKINVALSEGKKTDSLSRLSNLKEIIERCSLFQSTNSQKTTQLSRYKIKLTIHYAMNLMQKVFPLDAPNKTAVENKMAALSSSLYSNKDQPHTALQMIEKWIAYIESRDITFYADLLYLMNNNTTDIQKLVEHKFNERKAQAKEIATNTALSIAGAARATFGFAAEKVTSATHATLTTLSEVAERAGQAVTTAAENTAEKSAPSLNRVLGSAK